MGSSAFTPLKPRRRRAHARPPAMWGITGSIGMGKTTVANQFRQEGIPVFCSDEAVHEILAKDARVKAAIAQFFPKAVVKGVIQRPVLGKLVFRNPEALMQLEGILHPAVWRAQRAFIAQACRKRQPLVLFDIPLLYETGAEERLDGVIVVTAPKEVQRKRVLRRPGMTEEKLDAILSRQWKDGWKRRRAQQVIHTGLGMGYSKRQVMQQLQHMLGEKDA